MVKVFIKKNKESAIIPTRASGGSAGYDLYACINDQILLHKNEIQIIPTGISLLIPNGYEGQVRPRSGLASKYGITLPNSPGTIDSDYRGEIKVPLINLINSSFYIKPRMRIAQILIKKTEEIDFVLAKNLTSTNRGENGFGSSGI